jgi:hypothetical protein
MSDQSAITFATFVGTRVLLALALSLVGGYWVRWFTGLAYWSGFVAFLWAFLRTMAVVVCFIVASDYAVASLKLPIAWLRPISAVAIVLLPLLLGRDLRRRYSIADAGLVTGAKVCGATLLVVLILFALVELMVIAFPLLR